VRRLLLCAALLAACLSAHAQQDKDKDKGKPKPTEPTQDFVTKAVESCLAEIDLGRLAAKQAEDGEVRKFARRMIDDHEGLRKELAGLLDGKRIELPERADAEHQLIAKRLAAKKGPPFDQTYLERRVGDQEAVLGMFERQARFGRDDRVKDWAGKKLPDLRANLKAARDLQRRVRGSEKVTEKDKDKDK